MGNLVCKYISKMECEICCFEIKREFSEENGGVRGQSPLGEGVMEDPAHYVTETPAPFGKLRDLAGVTG
jgi:hypothetical protein